MSLGPRYNSVRRCKCFSWSTKSFLRSRSVLWSFPVFSPFWGGDGRPSGCMSGNGLKSFSSPLPLLPLSDFVGGLFCDGFVSSDFWRRGCNSCNWQDTHRLFWKRRTPKRSAKGVRFPIFLVVKLSSARLLSGKDDDPIFSAPRREPWGRAQIT